MADIAIFTAAGTWAGPDQGYPADVAREVVRRNPRLFEWRPINYPASFGPVPGAPNPLGGASPSYYESVMQGYNIGRDMIRSWRGPFALIGYSQGAEVIAKLAWAMMYGELKDRLHDCHWGVTFGNPCRGANRSFPGGPQNQPGEGISRHNLTDLMTIDWLDYAFNEDMYPCAPIDSYLGLAYDFAIGLQIHDVWSIAQWISTQITTGQLLPTLAELPTPAAWVKMANTFTVVTKFLSINPHVQYDAWEIVPGWTPAAHAINHLSEAGSRLVGINL